ncbi:dedicator of cytokinesis protein 3-like [Liolophura sinensis]|uniref:dedicator of cytokinesis protein 3-like n=1 Tax=Liolophura sinensis TaxID=3198878 RepID=UPI0031592572
MAWRPSRIKCGVGVCNCKAQGSEGLEVRVGEIFHILEDYHAVDNQPPVWFRGTSLRSKGKMGVFPASCIAAKKFTVENEGKYETVTPSQNATVKEVVYVLHEWCPLWKKLYLARDLKLFQDIGKTMLELIRLRRQLLSDTLTHDQVKDVKQKIISLIDWGNRNLGLEFVPRINQEQVEADATSAVKLYRIHAQHTSNIAQGAPGERVGSGDVKHAPIDDALFHVNDFLCNPGECGGIGDIKPAHTYHILFHLKGFLCNVGDTTDIFFSLYDAQQNTHISERFKTTYTKNGIPEDMERLHEDRVLFTSLGYSDLQKDLYIIACMYRRGKMKVSESSKRLLSKNSTCLQTTIWVCSSQSSRVFAVFRKIRRNRILYESPYCNESESQFPILLEAQIKKQSHGARYIASGNPTQSQALVGSLRCLDGDLQQVHLQNPLLFSKPFPRASKMGFPDVINPADVRNDLYITLYCGEFEKGDKSAARNIEVTMTVYDSNGDQIQDCIIAGSGDSPNKEYQTAVFYHNNKPEWNETVNVCLNMDQFPGSHIRLDFKHCSTRFRAEKKLFAFSYVSITSEAGVTLKDGMHNLCVYKCVDPKKLQNTSNYRQLISFVDDLNVPEAMASVSSGPKFDLSRERFTICSKLCSTKFTQKADLMAVLQWKRNPKYLPAILEKLQNLEGGEMVQFLQDILDAVFDMFGSHMSNAAHNSPQVFNALVYILNLLKKPEFENFIPVLDTYIAKTFSASALYKDLIQCIKDKVHQGSESRRVPNLLTTFEVLDYLFKILVRSRELSRSMSVEGDENFKEEISKLFKEMHNFIALDFDGLQMAQRSLLLHLFKCSEVLEHLLPKEDVCNLLCDLVRVSKDGRGGCQQAKIQLLRDCVNSDLFRIKDCRNVLLPVCKSQIKKCLIQKGDVKHCTDLLGDILHCLSTLKDVRYEKVAVYSDVSTLVLALFDVVLQTAQHYQAQHDDPEHTKVVPPLVACIIEMLKLMDDSHYSELLQSYPRGKPMKQFLTRVLTTFQELIKANIFPKDWFVMKMVTNNVILTAVQYFAQALTDYFHEDLEFDYQNHSRSIWSSYFHLAVAFITQPSLQLGDFSQGKREIVLERYGDMRVLLGFQIQTLWQSLGNHKHYFIPDLVGPFLEITLVPSVELRKAMLPIFFDMMESQIKHKGHCKELENEMILQLDQLVTSYKGDVEVKTMFENIMQEKLRGNMGLKENGTAFMKSITNLLEQLLEYRQVLDGEENRDKRMHCTFNILNFYKADGNRTEMYVRYIDKLHTLHVDAQNYVEAGFTLLLYADLLPEGWADDALQAELSYPPQRVWERKEALFKDIIDHFDKGKSWEYCIPLCKELAQLYEKKCYDYLKLSEILQKQAKCFTNILEGPALRQAPAYYRIAYYGQSFPPFVQNKEFVYRGDECQRLGALISQLQTEFPSATIMSSNSAPPENIKNGEAQNIQISSVKPVPKDRPEFVNNAAPSEIRQFYQVNEIDTFQLDIPFHRGEKDKTNEFKTLCIERTILQTSYTLPGILRSFEVVSSRRVSLTPIECAIERMNEVNMELRSLVDKCRMQPNEYFNQLEMRLNGVISPSVNGGIPLFQEAFFTSEFPQQHPEESKHLSTLKATVVEQIQLLETGLKLHGMIAPASLQPLHKSLEDSFRSLKRSVRESGSPSFVHSLHSSPGSSRGPADTNSVKSLTSTPPSSNRSSTTSSDINLMKFEEDDIYTEAQADYEAIPSLPQKRLSFSCSTGDVPSPSGSPSQAQRPHSVFIDSKHSTDKPKEMVRNGKTHGSDSNLLANRVPVQTSQKGLKNSKSSENIRPPMSISSNPSSHLRRNQSQQGPKAGHDSAAPPLPVRRPITVLPKSIAPSSPSASASVNGKDVTPPSLPVSRKASAGQLGVLTEVSRLSAVEEKAPEKPKKEVESKSSASVDTKSAPPLPPKNLSVRTPPPPAPKPSHSSRQSHRAPNLPPRRNSQKESPAEATKL